MTFCVSFSVSPIWRICSPSVDLSASRAFSISSTWVVSLVKASCVGVQHFLDAALRRQLVLFEGLVRDGHEILLTGFERLSGQRGEIVLQGLLLIFDRSGACSGGALFTREF